MQNTRERGTLLTVYLVLSFIGNLIGCGSYFTNQYIIKLGQPALPDSVIIVSTILSILNLVFVVGTWNLKKWGVYGLIGSAVIGFVNGFISGTLTVFTSIIGVGFFILLIYLTRPVWANENNTIK